MMTARGRGRSEGAGVDRERSKQESLDDISYRHMGDEINVNAQH